MGFVTEILEYLFAHPLIIIAFVLLYIIIFGLSVLFSGPKPGRNPFRNDARRPVKDLVLEQEKRDRVLKQGFHTKRIPENLDAIIIGSGIGGLSTAAVLSKAGKKVLVLEQHDQAGGCCHTFIDKGFEFDVGIHYIGEMRNNTISKIFIEQITEGQLQWMDLIDTFDVVALGEPGKQRLYPYQVGGKEKWKQGLLEKFPNEEKALDKFIHYVLEVHKSRIGYVGLKTIPRWLGKILIYTGLVSFLGKWLEYSRRSLKEVVDEITDNKDLRAVLSYSFGDYGTNPSRASFAMHANLVSHYLYGGSYPRGGASEIAFHIIPVIENSGGRVLVRAPVRQILVENGRATGVRVQRSSGDVDVFAPLVISDAGLINTFMHLLPRQISEKTSMRKYIHKKVDSGVGALSVFVGLNGTAEELGLKPQHIWAFTDNDLDAAYTEYMDKPRDEVLDSDVPLLFISFPSTKDPTYNIRFPGKSVCTIVTLGNWDWFKDWEHEKLKNRGDEYETFKQAIGRRIWDQVLALYPHLRDKVEYFDIGSPVTNKYYLGAPQGEIYGLDHTRERFGDPEVVMNLRPQTDIKGLYLAGQDVFNCGFIGAAVGGLLCASEVLHRNLLTDLRNLKAKIAKDK